ncbi:MAG: S8 family serine peptidase, partial [Chloroflexi bacterium]|nr:S8 family serine peptidase [Chloroflexota bacterium]
MEKAVERAGFIRWYKAFSLLLTVALLVPLMVTAPAPEAAPRAQPLLLAMAAERPEETVRVIVQKVAQDTSVEDLAARLGGVVTRDLYIINAFAAELPAKALPRLARTAGVRWVSLDAPVFGADDEDDDKPSGIITVRDEFGAVSYKNNDGAVYWTGDWVEIGESDGPGVGDVAVTSFLGGTRQGLRIQNANKGIRREANLSGTGSAVLSFDYRRKGFEKDHYVAVEISADGGASWKELDRLAGPATDPDVQFVSYDISSYVSSNTAIRFVSSPSLGEQDKLYIDNVYIEYTLTDGSSLDAVKSKPAFPRDSFDAIETEAQLASSGGTETVRDEFNAVSYSNNDGTQSWSGDWVEDDPEVGGEGPSAGQVRIVDGELRLDDQPDTGGEPSVGREVDLSGGVTAATFSFDFRTSWGVDWDDAIAVEVSSDGGANYTVLETFTGIWGATWGSRSFDISGYISADTMIRFRVANKYGGSDEFFFADNIQIEYVGGCSECIDTSNLANAYIRAIGADQLWNEALYLQGQGVTVAVVDSGIAPHDDLLDGVGNSRVVAQVDLTGGLGLPDDFYGHGTHVAGIIGGNGAKSDGTYIGVAPKVNLVDVKVIDDNGTGTTSDVVAGLQWILDNRAVYDIRVVNLSLNSSVAESYNNSPLDAALEILWFNNIVVVVSAGNNGGGALYAPANDPFVIVAGAADDMGTADIADDVLSSFSAYGMTVDGFVKPDLISPGRDVISLLASDDCNLALAHPAHAVAGPYGNYYFRMSGTSMASAVTAGAVALLLQDEPGLTPDQVKHRLMATTQPFDGPTPSSTGAGYLDIYAAVHGATTGSANTAKITSTSLRDGNYEIYVMDADGLNQTRLTNNAASDDRPAWSPDRSKIAFASDRNGNWEIYVMDADGSNPINLTNHAYNDRYPVWSPDGSQIAFYKYYPDNWEIYVMDADGANQTRLTFNAVSDSYPAWSPDGSQIAFHSDRDGNYE